MLSKLLLSFEAFETVHIGAVLFEGGGLARVLINPCRLYELRILS